MVEFNSFTYPVIMTITQDGQYEPEVIDFPDIKVLKNKDIGELMNTIRTKIEDIITEKLNEEVVRFDELSKKENTDDIDYSDLIIPIGTPMEKVLNEFPMTNKRFIIPIDVNVYDALTNRNVSRKKMTLRIPSWVVKVIKEKDIPVADKLFDFAFEEKKKEILESNRKLNHQQKNNNSQKENNKEQSK